MLFVFVFPQKRAIAFWPCPARELSRILCVFCACFVRVWYAINLQLRQGLGAGNVPYLGFQDILCTLNIVLTIQIVNNKGLNLVASLVFAAIIR